MSFKIFKGVLWRRQASKDDVLVALSRLAFHSEYMAHPLRKLLRAPTHAQKEEIRAGKYAKALRDCALTKAGKL